MIKLRCALRNIFRARWDNFAKIISLSLGLSVGLVVFSVIAFHFSFDNFFPDGERIYQMRVGYDLNGEKDESDMLVAPIAPALVEDMPGVESATRMFRSWELRYFCEGNWFAEKTIFCDSLLFDVLDFGVIAGDPHTGLAGKNMAFISESTARRIFPQEDPVGKTILYNNNVPMTVTGVFRDVPENCHFRCDIALSWATLNILGLSTGWDGGDSFRTYLKLAPGVKTKDIDAALPQFFKKYGHDEMMNRWGMSYFFVPIKDVHSGEREVILFSILLGIMASVILFIAALNFALLTLSSLADRARTIGVHKCSGARASGIFAMLLTEAALYILFSTLIAIGIILAFSPQIRTLTGESLTSLFAPQRLWFALAVLAGLFAVAGILPARVFASVPVSAAYRPAAPGQRTWKRALLLAQFAAATFVLVFLLIVVRQYDMFMKKDIGYDCHNVLYFKFPPTSGEKLDLVRGELLSMPQVEEVSVTREILLGLSGDPTFDSETKELLFSCRFTGMDCHTIPLLGIDLLSGSNFTEDMGWQHVIVNEKYVEKVRWTDDPVGKTIVDSRDRPTTIVGVARDFMTSSLQWGVEPLVIHALKTQPEKEYENLLLVKLGRVTPANVEAVNRKLSSLYPGQPVSVGSYAETIASEYTTEKQLRNTVAIVGTAVLLIALAGIVGYISYELRRRSRELAIRKIHGASRGDILRAVSADIAVIVAAAATTGTAAAWFAGEKWLGQFACRIPLSWWIFAAGAGTVLLIVTVAVLLKTRGILNENSVNSIKTE